MLAKDYKMDPLWKPELSAAGSKAAVLAHKDGAKLNLWMPEASKEGHSAATLAMGKKGLGPNVQIGANEDQKAKALMAATASHNDAMRKRASSQPATRPATSMSGRRVEQVDANSWSSDAMQAARAQNLRMSREMFTEHPPVELLDKEEQRHQAALRASAISMAQKMYATQQHHISAASGHAESAGIAAVRNDRSGTALTEDNLRTAAMQHLTLQEAAQRLAEERLAKMKTNEEEAFREHYGYGRSPSKKIGSRLSIRGRRRASSDVTGEPSVEQKPFDRWADSDDEEQSRRIRKQMSGLRGQVADVDAKKKQKDRQALLAAAERNVQARMGKMDERVYNDTGKMSPAMAEEWERNARKRLEEKRQQELERSRSQSTQGVAQKKERVHIGGGKHMDMAEIEAIARARLQGTLQEIDEQAEKKRAEDEDARMGKEQKKRESTMTKEREREKKAEEKRIRGKFIPVETEWSRADPGKAEEKEQAKQAKEAEKAKRLEEKRMSKVEKDRLKDHPLPAHHDDHEPRVEDEETAAGGLATEVPHETTDAAATAAAVTAPAVVEPTAHTTGTTVPVVTSVPHPLTVPADEPSPTDEPILADEPEEEMHDVEPTATAATELTAPSSVPKSSEDTKPVSSNEKASVTTPPDSPTKDGKGLKGLFSKFKRRSKADPGQVTGFSGGHRLSKEKQVDDAATPATVPETTPATAPAAAAGATATATGRDSPSVSSLDESDVEDEPRGRARHSPHLNEASPAGETEVQKVTTAATTSTDDKKGDEFEEARDTFDETLSPPQPAFTSTKEDDIGSTGSPHRDSKFVENV